MDTNVSNKNRKAIKGGKGWHESANYTGKAPEHYRVSVKKGMERMLRAPMVRGAPLKWDEVKIIAELKKIIVEIGYFPGDKELRKLKRVDLASAITKNGGLSELPPYK